MNGVEVVGSGFLARNLAAIAADHSDVVALASGVSSTGCRSVDEFTRDAELVYATVRRCLVDGRRILFFSSASASVYAGAGCPGREDGPVYPVSSYGRHKLAMEAVLANSGVNYVALRLTHVVGPDQPAHQLLPGLVAQLCSGEVTVHRGSCRDVVAVDDVVSIVDAVLRTGVNRTVVNVGSGCPVPAERIVAHLQRRLAVRPVWRCVDRPTYYRVSLDRLTCLVPSIARLGFGPNYYRAALDRYLDHYRADTDLAG